jgi:hypothetical protein
VAGDIADSYLAAVLFEQYNKSNFASVSTCVPYKHYQDVANLSATDQHDITTWIQNGAKND